MPASVGGSTGEGVIIPNEVEGGCRYVQGEGEAKGIFVGEDCNVGRAVAKLTDARMVYETPQTTYSNPVEAIPKGKGYSLAGDFKVANQQSELVAAPPMLLEEQALAFARAVVFTTVDLNQGY